MRSTIFWLLWLVLPVFVLAYHYGPGQAWLARDHAAAMIRQAERESHTAIVAQNTAYETQLDALAARRDAFAADVDWQSQLQHPLALSVVKATSDQDKAYDHAAELWDKTAELYREAADELLKVDEAAQSKNTPAMSVDDLNALESLRWAEARAMVRSGEVFTGVNQLEALMTFRLAQKDDPGFAQRIQHSSALPTDAIREELAAAQYVGARLLREEGRPPEVWRPVANSARQHYRYLTSASNGGSPIQTSNAEKPIPAKPIPAKPSAASKTDDDSETLGRHDRFQRNLEQVLNLEQNVTDQLQGIPLPRSSPQARRAGDGEPGKGKRPGQGPGRGPLQDGPPNSGAGLPGPMGRGW